MDAETAGMIAFAVSLTYTMLGLPAQIWKNHQRRSVEGLSFLMTVLLALNCASWILYGYLKHDPYMLGANLAVCFWIAILLWQFLKFRPRS
ncbi:MAG: SWEET family sugar transporter [Oligoflexia bacterium]|nr:SWEET family sugar transporter [Oligoflexia bacterium]